MGGGGVTTIIAQTSDSTDDKALMEHAAEELLACLSNKDIKGIREALRALVKMIKQSDED